MECGTCVYTGRVKVVLHYVYKIPIPLSGYIIPE